MYSFNEAIKLNPKKCKAWMQKGVALHDLAKYEEAIDR